MNIDNYDGISIQDLQNYNQSYMQQSPFNQMQNTANQQQFQQPPQLNQMQNYMQQPSQQLMQTYTNPAHMADFAQEIETGLSELDLEDINTEVEPPKKQKKKKKSSNTTIPQWVREPLVIMLWFILLSQGTVKDYLQHYIPQLSKNESGKVGQMGIITYGLMLALLVTVTKKIWNKYN